MDHGSRRTLMRDTRGAVFAEYTTLVVLVTLIGSLAVVAVGPHLLRTFRYAELVVALPFP